MARLQPGEAAAPPSAIPALADLPTFRCAKPQDALDVARVLFIAEERLEMGSLAERLGVNRGTLYRWFGSRDQLVEQMLVQFAEAFSASAHAQAEWEGDERVLDFARRVMDATAHFQPLRTFVAREPELALRLLIGERGPCTAASPRPSRQRLPRRIPSEWPRSSSRG
jgi:AcrR family transcriptional regulator